MTVAELWNMIKDGGKIILILMTLIQLTPIKINPWDGIIKAIGNVFNKEVISQIKKTGEEVEKLKTIQEENAKKMAGHIKNDDERDTDSHRYRILRFNTEVMRHTRHTKEEFDEILYSIKCYEKYCREHPDYENDRAVLAIENVKRVYLQLMARGGFLEYQSGDDSDGK